MSVQFRKAKSDDAMIIAQTHCASWLTTYRGLIADHVIVERTNVEKRARGWEPYLCDPETGVWIAFDNDVPCLGFVSFGKRKSQDVNTDGQITSLYLLQTVQRKGVGRALIAIAMHEMLARKFKSACVEVLKDNPAEKFYSAMGALHVFTGYLKEFGEDIIEHTYVWRDLELSLQTSVETAPKA
jgi:L-amino acid N-acyltransferase YncA